MDNFLCVLGIIGLILLEILAFAVVIAIVAAPFVLVWVVFPISTTWKCILTVMLICFSGGGTSVVVNNK